jgi:hypothetical protein
MTKGRRFAEASTDSLLQRREDLGIVVAPAGQLHESRVAVERIERQQGVQLSREKPIRPPTSQDAHGLTRVTDGNDGPAA